MRRSEIERRIVAQLGDPDGQLLHIATVNPEYVQTALRNVDFREALDRAELALPDGVGVVAAARILHGVQIERTTGVDLVEFLLNACLSHPPRVFLLGNPESLAELQGRHPVRVVGRWGGGRSDPRDDGASIMRIRERRANVLLVGYGAPAQLLWIERNRQALNASGVRIAIGVGGALDFVAGTVDRAPEWARRLGLEWLYRLLHEPWRWRRQRALPVFAVQIARERLSRRPRVKSGSCRILSNDDEPERNDTA